MSQLGLFGGAPAAPPPLRAPPPPAPAPHAPEQVLEVPAAPAEPLGGPVAHVVGPSRFVVCPQRITGSMDAEDVTLADWLGTAQAMARREELGVVLYEVTANGSWSKRAVVDKAGRVLA